MAFENFGMMPDPGQASSGPVGFWDHLLALSQQRTRPGLGSAIGNAIGGQYAPGVGYMWDMLGPGWSMPKASIQPSPMMPEKQLPSGGDQGFMAMVMKMLPTLFGG